MTERVADGGNGPNQGHTVAILGAGPIGLDAALMARARGFRFRVYEQAPTPAGNVRSWGHVRLFSPWTMNVSGRMQEGLDEVGRPLEVDPEASPTGHELADRVLDPLWALPELREALRLDTRVVAVGRSGTLKDEEIGTPARAARPFRILLQGPDGDELVEYADIVLDCTGRWATPNTLGDGGIPAPGERGLQHRIHRRIPDLPAEMEAWAGRTVLVAGAGHSAQTAACALAEVADGNGRSPRVFWLFRDTDPSFLIEDDPLPLRRELALTAEKLARGEHPAVIPVPGRVVERLVEVEGGGVEVTLRDASAPRETLRVDGILALTGGVGDHGIYRQLQVHECYATCGPIKLSAALLGADSGGDCLAQGTHGAETLVNPEPGFYILGDKSYGRNSTFLLQIGWAQVDEVFSLF
ncbi:MAG: hypothetical protein EA422_04485 [Gemmatimonadales bacterium]|nr:MAG: hypothetical protein EA422_04485 [Gemmatimonadales bacterium]